MSPDIHSSTTQFVLAKGSHLGRYELLTPIARGGMAIVWLARADGAFGFRKLVAIKIIRPEFAENEEYRRMFIDEARIHSLINHPNVAQVLDVGTMHGVLYQVFEWIDGDSLAALHRSAVRQGKLLPRPVVVKLMSQICAGLGAAHELTEEGRHLAVVHRDVSPQNVLVTADGVAKIIDFGIAKSTHRQRLETKTGIVKGKLAYMAPEQARGERVDHRADLWSTGVMLHLLTTGHLPIMDRRRGDILEALRGDRDPTTEDILLEIVLNSALAPKAIDRFSSAWEMEVALESLARRIGDATASEIRDGLKDHRMQLEARRLVVKEAIEESEQRRSGKAPESTRATTDTPPDSEKFPSQDQNSEDDEEEDTGEAETIPPPSLEEVRELLSQTATEDRTSSPPESGVRSRPLPYSKASIIVSSFALLISSFVAGRGTSLAEEQPQTKQLAPVLTAAVPEQAGEPPRKDEEPESETVIAEVTLEPQTIAFQDLESDQETAAPPKVQRRKHPTQTRTSTTAAKPPRVALAVAPTSRPPRSQPVSRKKSALPSRQAKLSSKRPPPSTSFYEAFSKRN